MKTFLKYFLYFLLIAILLLMIGFFIFYNPFAKKQLAEPRHTVDAVVVLTGGRGRLDASFKLMREKRAKKLFISGVNKNVSVSTMKEILKNNKIDASRVAFGYISENTFENAIETREFMEKEKFRSMYLVTSDYHMSRAMLEFRYFLPEFEVRPYLVKSSRKVKFFISEYFKYLRSFIRIKLGIGEL